MEPDAVASTHLRLPTGVLVEMLVVAVLLLNRARVGPLGDARLNLEREPAQQFDVLTIDAFSSDAIPVHLITLEALDVYRRHMKPDGVIAFHVTNRFLDLVPIVEALGKARAMRV